MPETNLKILLVEDDSVFRAYTLKILSSYNNHNNISAVTAKEALQKFKDAAPDITFLDISLPDGNGIELLNEFKKINPNAFVVMLTGSDTMSDVNKSQAFGADGYILKPLNNEKVEELIQKFINFKKDLDNLSIEEIEIQKASAFTSSRKNMEQSKNFK